MDSRLIDESSLSASSRIRGCCLRIFVIPWEITTPNSSKKPRIWFTNAVLSTISDCRTRWKSWTSCCSIDLVATGWISARPSASHIPAESLESFFWLSTNALTCFAGRIFTVWPSAESFRYQWWDVAHDSIPIVHGEMFAKSDKKCDRMTRFFGSDFKMIIKKYEMIVTISQIYFRL